MQHVAECKRPSEMCCYVYGKDVVFAEWIVYMLVLHNILDSLVAWRLLAVQPRKVLIPMEFPYG